MRIAPEKDVNEFPTAAHLRVMFAAAGGNWPPCRIERPKISNIESMA
jgi:hypothetical protein